MNDRELLELAAKAAGYGEVWYLEGSDTPYVGPRYEIGGPVRYRVFNPLTDDGDALRLAVVLGIEPRYLDRNCLYAQSRVTLHGIPGIVENEDGDPYAATRRAIVRAAAEIGKAMS